ASNPPFPAKSITSPAALAPACSTSWTFFTDDGSSAPDRPKAVPPRCKTARARTAPRRDRQNDRPTAAGAPPAHDVQAKTRRTELPDRSDDRPHSRIESPRPPPGNSRLFQQNLVHSGLSATLDKGPSRVVLRRWPDGGAMTGF